MEGKVATESDGDCSLLRRAMGDFRGVPVASIFSLILVFLFLRAGIIPLGRLPAEKYEHSLIAWEAVKSLPDFGIRILPGLMVVAVLCWKWRLLMVSWREWEHGRAVRSFVVVAAAVLLWQFATYDYNSFFGQWHALDRVLLVVGFAGLCWRPVFVFPFLIQVVLLAGQFAHPLGGFSWIVPDQAIHLLILFLSFHLFSLATGIRKVDSFVFVAVCLVAAHYWTSGYLKLRGGWLQGSPIEFVLPNTYAGGWLEGLSPDSIGKWTNVFAQFSPFIKIFTLIVECGFALCFLHRRAALFFLSSCILFHLGIFLIMGFCFWAWAIVNACLLLLIWKRKLLPTKHVFGGVGFCLAFLLIITSHKWLNPGKLMWFDARATYTYRIYGEGPSGKEYHLPPRYFQPYNYQFVMGFGFLSEERTLPVTLGATSKSIANALMNTRTGEEVLALEKELGTNRYDPRRRDRLEAFLRKFVAGVNESADRKTALRKIQSPRILWAFGEDGAYQYEEPIHRLTVVQVLSFFDGNTYQEIRRKPVLEVEIPAKPGTEAKSSP